MDVLNADTQKTRLPKNIIKKAARRIRFVGNPKRLHILEFLDINGPSSVSEIMRAVDEPQVVVSQSLKKMKEVHLLESRKKGRNVIYTLNEVYPILLLDCMRSNYIRWNCSPSLDEGEKAFLPFDFVSLVAERINLIGHPLRLHVLEFLDAKGECSVSEIMDEVKAEQTKVSQNLKKLKDHGIVNNLRDGRFIYYGIAVDLPRTLLTCMRKQYDELDDKTKF